MIRVKKSLRLELVRPLARLGEISSLFIALLLLGCTSGTSNITDNDQPSTVNSTAKRDGNYIIAEPNPVARGLGPGTTKISWGVVEKSNLQIYVAANDSKETLFAETAGPGSQEAPWIVNDAIYEFRLYSGSGSDRKLLDKVVVTREK